VYKRQEHTHCKKLVIGLSGGLDSALALLVAVKAADMSGIDRKNVLAVTMPCFGTTKRTKSNAEILAQGLGVDFCEVNISKSVEQHFADISQPKDKYDVTFENAQARERTQVLMDIANKEGGLVIGTGDLSELALGWATYNGDHMSMYGVNGGIPKTLVRYLVSYYADEYGDKDVKAALCDILDTPVSPELLPSDGDKIAQQTENIVGPYELHDFFLYYIIRWGYSPKKVYRIALKTFDGVYDKETLLKWLNNFYKRFFTQQFKRSCLPDGVKVGSVALSPRGDWRMPSDASARIWLDELQDIK
jgi:NAD+ synthase (glutamine-hydrolysing)